MQRIVGPVQPGCCNRNTLCRDGLPKNVVENAPGITLSNAKVKAIIVDMISNILGYWRMLKNLQPHRSWSGTHVERKVSVPADVEAELTYRIRV